MSKLTLEQAHKYSKAIWKWLSENSDPKSGPAANKYCAIEALKINIEFKDFCPYCQYVSENEGHCTSCPIAEKYSMTCFDIGYFEYRSKSTKKNAKKFYNKIKDL